MRLAESVGINQAAMRLDMPSSSLGNWARLKRKGKLAALPRATPITGSAAELEAENERLRRELANAKLDLEIVKRQRISRTSRGEIRLDRTASRRLRGNM